VRFIIGIDEVGRGPLAGPMEVGAVCIPVGLRLARKDLRDSKRLTAKARGEWTRYIASHAQIYFALARVSPRVIDRMNVSRAANLAALRAARRLALRVGMPLDQCTVYLDGGLYLGNGKARLPAKTIIKGDETVPAIALASIMAKVHRDHIMLRYEEKFPGYGFGLHKGYGTKIHGAALKQLGPSPVHRLTFLEKWNTINPKSHGWRTNKTS